MNTADELTSDQLGIKPDNIEARIEKCKRHPDLIPQAEALLQRALDMAANSTGSIDWQFIAQYGSVSV